MNTRHRQCLHRRYRALLSCLVAMASLLTPTAEGQSAIYGVDWNTGVVRVNRETGVREVILSDPTSQYTSITISPDGSHLFLGTASGMIVRADLAGSVVDTLLTEAAFGDLHGGRGGSPCGHDDLFLDQPSAKLYATGSGWCGSHFIRMNFDGSALYWIGGSHTGGSSMALQPDTRRVYLAVPWPPAVFAGIITRDLDTANPDTLIRADSTMGDALFDFTSGKMYWASGDSVAILKANLDGSDVEKVTELAWTPSSTSLALDTQNGHLYYTSYEQDMSPLFRVNLDGSEQTTVAEGGFSRMIVVPTTATDRETSVAVPRTQALSQNYPNPFNPTTTITYSLPHLADVALTVYDLLGRPVQVLASGMKPAGIYEVTFDATGLASGLYVYRLQAGDYVNTKRMVVVK